MGAMTYMPHRAAKRATAATTDSESPHDSGDEQNVKNSCPNSAQNRLDINRL